MKDNQPQPQRMMGSHEYNKKKPRNYTALIGSGKTVQYAQSTLLSLIFRGKDIHSLYNKYNILDTYRERINSKMGLTGRMGKKCS